MNLKVPRRILNLLIPESGKLYAPPGHYYSPIVNTRSLTRSNIDDSNYAGIDIDISEMDDLFSLMIEIFEKKSESGIVDAAPRYSQNRMFNFVDASIYEAMIRLFRPRRIVEVGCGYSSACALDTLDAVRSGTSLTLVDPNPERLKSLLRPEDYGRMTLIESNVQSVPLSVFESLESGDFLFLDTTHVSKTGSDVNHDIFNILPLLKPGIFVHFHDIFAGFEYPKTWIFDENRSWNEAYMLKAFLMYNPRFKVVFFNDYYLQKRPKRMRLAVPDMPEGRAGSIWLKVTDEQP
jgi:predicted O-methyltransferase YrrM